MTTTANPTLLDEFDKAVEKHDLTYHYSDDGRYYRAGRDSMQRISELAKQLPREDVVRIWNKWVDKKIVPHCRHEWYWKM